MTWAAVHQFVPTLIQGDAIGDHVLRLQAQQRSLGRRAEIFVDVERDETAALTRTFNQLDRHVEPDATLLLYHVAQASRCARFLLERSEPLGLVFHNFTPVGMLVGWDTSAACDLLDAERQLTDLAAAAIVGICDSHYNARQLEDHGVVDTHVACIPVAPPADEERRPAARPTILFVGRVAPNKAFHDLITAVALLRHRIPDVRLRLVGGPTSKSYSRSLAGLVTALGLDDEVVFTGRVSDEQLLEEYRSAHVFCCLSDHEGFGVPLLEAMAHGLPVVAHDSSAVGETVGGAGILLDDKQPAVVATALERVLTEPALADALRAAGLERARSYSDDRCAREVGVALDAAWETHTRTASVRGRP